MRAFLDTGSLYARINRKDPDYQSIMEFLQKMLRGQVKRIRELVEEDDD